MLRNLPNRIKCSNRFKQNRHLRHFDTNERLYCLETEVCSFQMEKNRFRNAWKCCLCALETNRFWIDFESFLNRFWIDFESILNRFWIDFKSILNRFWIDFDSLSEKCQCARFGKSIENRWNESIFEIEFNAAHNKSQTPVQAHGNSCFQWWNIWIWPKRLQTSSNDPQTPN